MNLILSELGGYITGFLFAQSGTKRLSNLFRNDKWYAKDLEDAHLEEAKKHPTFKDGMLSKPLGSIKQNWVYKPLDYKNSKIGSK